MIKHFKVRGLNHTLDYDLAFNPDLNIVTGKNGSGKTTLLKLIWYMLSPNVERTVPEIVFTSAKLQTDSFTLEIERKPTKARERVVVQYTGPDKKTHVTELWSDEFRQPWCSEKIEEVNRLMMQVPTGSVFFPTFRRIEGGFSLESDDRLRGFDHRAGMPIGEAMAGYSNMMTVRQHKFVASISTADVEDLLTRQYAEVSEKTNALHTELSQFISTTITGDRPSRQKRQSTTARTGEVTAEQILTLIKAKVGDIEERRQQLMKPFSVLATLIAEIFKDKGIRVTPHLAFGETKEAIRATILSAGEKQMLSFMCYNGFNRGIPIFIDEPELSLHIDWQRLLFPTLLSQGTANQFIVSTHSPFIYSKYPEKELVLALDKGGQ